MHKIKKTRRKGSIFGSFSQESLSCPIIQSSIFTHHATYGDFNILNIIIIIVVVAVVVIVLDATIVITITIQITITINDAISITISIKVSITNNTNKTIIIVDVPSSTWLNGLH